MVYTYNKTCNNPPTNTEILKAYATVLGSSCMEINKAAIIARFSNILDMAVVKKCSLYCSSVAKKETIKMRSKYQKFMAVSGAALAMVSASHPMASNLVISSGKKVTTNEPKMIKSMNLKNIAVANTPLFFEATKEGINACVKAPSAKIFRKRFGSLFATKNKSDQKEAPRTEAISTSRANPAIRDISMPKLLVNMDFNRMGLFSFKLFVF